MVVTPLSHGEEKAAAAVVDAFRLRAPLTVAMAQHTVLKHLAADDSVSAPLRAVFQKYVGMYDQKCLDVIAFLREDRSTPEDVKRMLTSPEEFRSRETATYEREAYASKPDYEAVLKAPGIDAWSRSRAINALRDAEGTFFDILGRFVADESYPMDLRMATLQLFLEREASVRQALSWLGTHNRIHTEVGNKLLHTLQCASFRSDIQKIDEVVFSGPGFPKDFRDMMQERRTSLADEHNLLHKNEKDGKCPVGRKDDEYYTSLIRELISGKTTPERREEIAKEILVESKKQSQQRQPFMQFPAPIIVMAPHGEGQTPHDS